MVPTTVREQTRGSRATETQPSYDSLSGDKRRDLIKKEAICDGGRIRAAPEMVSRDSSLKGRRNRIK